MFDFDRVIDRRGTHASKWDMMAKLSGITAADGIPMWVADMDFAAPPGVTEVLSAAVTRAVHGYYADTGSWAAALAEWMARRHGFSIDPAWVSPTPGVVSGLGLILQAVTEAGDEVVVFPPAYHAFRRIILANDRRILDAQLVQRQGRYEMDLDALAKKLTPRTKIVFFCSPHNPGGTVWSSEEIRALATFCAERNLILVSDEIHCDLLLGGVKHTPTLSAAPEIADRLITCVAATKTFNLAGAHVGACVTSNPELKKRTRRADRGKRARLLQRLRNDRDRGGLANRRRPGSMRCCPISPAITICSPRGSRKRRPARVRCGSMQPISAGSISPELDWRPQDVAARVKDRARIFASPGEQFGPGGETWLRFNFATPRPILNEALDRLDDAFRDLRK